MNTSNIITFIVVLFLSLGSFIISGFQFAEKGILFNNAYLYASKKERETMNKKPHYRQSAISFLLVGIALLLLDIELFFAINKLYPVVVLIIISMIIYAIWSSINIERKSK